MQTIWNPQPVPLTISFIRLSNKYAEYATILRPNHHKEGQVPDN